MNSTQPRSHAAAFPILMRLPDLRPAAVEEASLIVESPSRISVTSLLADEPAASNTPQPTPENIPVECKIPAAPEPTPSATVSVTTAPEPQPEPAVVLPPALADATAHEEMEGDEEVTPVARAEARRQRSRQRQQQQREQKTVAEPVPQSWWSSQAPVIAVGFLLALAVTIFFARGGRQRSEGPQAGDDAQIPELVIDFGESSTSPTPETFPAAPIPNSPPQFTSAISAPEFSAEPPKKTPPLLASETEIAPSAAERSEPQNPTLAAETTLVTKPVANDFAEETQPSYPSTDPRLHRMGGRPPRTARAEGNPQQPNLSNNPNWR